MYAYDLRLAWHSIRRNPGLAALMVLAIALGVAVVTVTFTVYHAMATNPIEHKSERLNAVTLDTWDPQEPYEEDKPEHPPTLMTYKDATHLYGSKAAPRALIMYKSGVLVLPERPGVKPFDALTRVTTHEFFSMFDVPFQYGSGWDAAADDARARVAVVSKALNDKLFGGANSVGRTLRMDNTDFRIIGVLKEWRPVPKFYDLNVSDHGYGETEQVFLPFSTSRELDLGRSGNMNCYDTNPEGMRSTDVGANCNWIQFWVQLDTPAKAAEYKSFLENYSSQQRAAGRFHRPNNVRLRNLMEFLSFNKVVPGDVNLQMWLALAFLLVCLVNTIGLLLAKFLRRSSEVGVRRALGASRRAIFAQCMIEAGTVGLAGGVLGLGLAELGLWAVRHQPTEYATLAQLDPLMLATTFVLAIVASLLAGVLPAWRACLVSPAIQLKSQ